MPSDDAPPCPNCETTVLVARYSAHPGEDWLCYGCDEPFSRDDLPSGERRGSV